jgi:hypothetical protein
LPILPVLSLLGLFATLQRREYLLTGWALLPFFLDPRNAPVIAQYAYMLLAGEGLYFLREKFYRAYSTDVNAAAGNAARARVIATILFAFLGLYLLWHSFTSARDLARLSLKEADRATMGWVRKNTPADASFLLMTNAGQISPMTDAYQEWFPALAERRSVNTLQGLEWRLGAEFYEHSLRLTTLQACEDAACVQEWISDNGVKVDYLLARTRHVLPELLHSLLEQAGYEAVYESADAIIYRLEP